MSVSFSVDADANLVTVTYEDCESLDDRGKALEELVQLLIENPSLNIILDISELEKNLSDDEKFKCGVALASKSEYFNFSKLVLITKRKFKDCSIIMSVAYVNGLNSVIEFHNEHDARLWLRGDIP